MLQMLDRLRMDVGVPKDDSLNQMEFGYGSIKYSTGSFFPKPTPSYHQELESEFQGNQSLPGQSLIGRHPISSHKAVSDVTIIELHNRHPEKMISGDDSSRISSGSASLLNENSEFLCNNPSYDFPCRDSKDSSPPSSKSSSGQSMTESEIQRALGEVGFNAEVTRDITRIVKQGGKRHRNQKTIPELITLEPNNNNKPHK